MIDEKAWTVFGRYCDREFGEGEEGDFAGVFYAATEGGAKALASEYEPWLNWDSVPIVPGAVDGVLDRFPESQWPELES